MSIWQYKTLLHLPPIDNYSNLTLFSNSVMRMLRQREVGRPKWAPCVFRVDEKFFQWSMNASPRSLTCITQQWHTPIQCSSRSKQVGQGLNPRSPGSAAQTFAPHASSCGALPHSSTDHLVLQGHKHVFYKKPCCTYSLLLYTWPHQSGSSMFVSSEANTHKHVATQRAKFDDDNEVP